MDEEYKLIVIGETFSGKSCFVRRLNGDSTFNYHHQTVTTRPEFITRRVEIDGIRLNITIWDTMGQERFVAITRSYYLQSNGVFIFYNANDKDSFDQVSSWNRYFEENSGDPAVKVLIAAKCDLTQIISDEDGKKKANSIGAKYFKTSAMNNIGINEAFDYMIKELVAKHRPKNVQTIQKPPDVIRIRNVETPKKNCC